MGLFDRSNSNVAPAPLQPVHPPLGLFPQFTAQSEVTLKIKEKVLALGDTFYIQDAYTQGNILQCDGKIFSLRRRKAIKDMNGNLLFYLQNKILSFPQGFVGLAADESRLFEVKSQISFTGAKMNMHFINASTQQPVVLDLRGTFFERRAEIMMNGQVVGRVSRQFLNARQLLADNLTFYVTVAPGCDIALIVAFVLSLADREENNK
ncbi:tubby C-terminal-like domain-containing protein [Rhodocollybia butyracea]|uniref:Tubby C-terminal-like domain-containing protein n=1 Tax=Rhodocollybia butyracea TaxID=206335 RepID=A0A9P5PM33_9AGAR|nr:tubby C-terminal-like domain-containing protein [Rhodocollybia butyracea]